ncbi:MAG: undecaprenyldiphospho-muramoylpentapeptide beta-N-acetylglucosaminyltransferase [Candidatus Omnitrophica bacterium]|nr:undecaprenyldiphospho-muramoylpentapeptide beta-N-acetylglucosaminyltransferase [Candidatus Omnitrophota bacterium]MCB9720841.1 undecaprenyldiphospho-muramoylpentapeptide beta-N-acetylglucosaminyltransferase [Candidatus Omnitrophota bacterium]
MRVMLAAGGTAGHLGPAVEVARWLRREGHAVTFVGALGDNAGRLRDEGFEARELAVRGLQGEGIRRDLSAVLSLIKGAWHARAIIKSVRPQVIAGFGGYAAFPVVGAAVMCGVPAVIHEQNVVPGRANRLLGRYVRKIAVSFRESRAHWSAGKIVVTGCPVSPGTPELRRDEFYRKVNFSPDRKTVLVFGGSQGSQRINTVFPACVGQLAARFPVQILHVSGRGRLPEVEAAYANVKVPNQLFEYYRPMATLYALADVIVCRAGAATVNELVVFGKPACLVPYPYAGGHQEFNARVLVEAGVALMIKDVELTPENLSDRIGELLNDPPPQKDFTRLQDAMNVNNATDTLAREILNTA